MSLFAAVAAAAASSFIVDVATQVTTQYIKTQSVDMTEIDYRRSLKTADQTGLGTAIPVFCNANGGVDAVATALIWGEASALIACADVIITNTTSSGETSSSGKKTFGMNRAHKEFLIMTLY